MNPDPNCRPFPLETLGGPFAVAIDTATQPDAPESINFEKAGEALRQALQSVADGQGVSAASPLSRIYRDRAAVATSRALACLRGLAVVLMLPCLPSCVTLPHADVGVAWTQEEGWSITGRITQSHSGKEIIPTIPTIPTP